MMVSGYTLFITFAVHHLIIGAVLLVLLSALFKLIKASAEVKSWLWLTAFLISTLVPLTAFIPHNDVKVKFGNLQVDVVERTETISEPRVEVITNKAGPQWHVPESVVAEGMVVLTVFLLMWLVGSVWRLISVVRSFLNTRKVVNSAQRLTQFNDVQYPVSMSLCASTPLVVGLFNPMVILPGHIVDTLDEQYLRPIIEHEVAHIKRGDLWMSTLQELLAMVFWWSPVVRTFNHNVHVNRELACDARAIKVLNSGKRYAQSLLECAKLMVSDKQNLLAVGLFSRKKELTERIDAALTSKKTASFRLWQVVGSCLLLSLASMTMAHHWAPRVNVDDVVKGSKHYSQLSRNEGEALINAVLLEDVQRLEFLVKEEGIDIDTPAIGDGTALIIAVRENLPEMVDALISLGADVDQSSRGDGNPLIMAAMTNNLEIAKQLLDYGAQVNAVVVNDETPLINATRRGLFDMTKLLVDHGADVNLKVKTRWVDGSVIRSPLNMTGVDEIKAYLVERGATM